MYGNTFAIWHGTVVEMYGNTLAFSIWDGMLEVQQCICNMAWHVVMFGNTLAIWHYGMAQQYGNTRAIWHGMLVVQQSFCNMAWHVSSVNAFAV